MRPAAPLYYLAVSIAAQTCGFGTALLLSREITWFQSPLAAVGVGALVAFLVGKSLRISLAWQILNLLLPPAIYFFNSVAIPSWVVGAAAFLVLIIYIPTFWTHVPFYPTSSLMYEEILKRLPADRAFRFIDLGSGYGSMLFYLAKRRPLGEFVGSEIAPLPWAVSRIRTLGSPNVRCTLKSFWQLDVGAYDVIYAFLSPTPMKALWEKVRREAKPGSIFMTNTFAVESESDETVLVEDKRRCTLYVHRM